MQVGNLKESAAERVNDPKSKLNDLAPPFIPNRKYLIFYEISAGGQNLTYYQWEAIFLDTAQ
jgi:hypothetical protein